MQYGEWAKNGQNATELESTPWSQSQISPIYPSIQVIFMNWSETEKDNGHATLINHTD